VPEVEDFPPEWGWVMDVVEEMGKSSSGVFLMSSSLAIVFLIVRSDSSGTIRG
jgi:hypothetical protein